MSCYNILIDLLDFYPVLICISNMVNVNNTSFLPPYIHQSCKVDWAERELLVQGHTA